MKSLFIIGLLLAGLISFSCKENGESKPKEEQKLMTSSQKAKLINGRWEVNYLAAMPKPMDSLFPRIKPSLIIDADKGQISGTTGCNNFSGKVSIEGKEFILDEAIALTKKMCPDMTGEESFMKTLQRVNTYSVTDRGQTLNLITGDMAVMRLQRVQED
ncbi:hypothetical protein GCM10023115_38580 [Pontixanthobacter gangjinensis]|uniref:META domain-containing protein n=1 Tax=Christiangramia aestuarii TaxID=1028746 RepID=A0A7M3SWM4_9FLAO|nr:META domain-containing protein [Christiangramia aestuarii]MUP41005.1 META domain-containing protein [Christiangramia aestuarii]